MTQFNTTAYHPGTRVRVSDKFGDNFPLRAGAEHTVSSCRSTASGFQIRLEDIDREYGSDWFESPEGAKTNGGGRIPFALTKDTSREYARSQVSPRGLDAEVNEVLLQAANGFEVDASEFRKAVTAALSLAATRAGQSMARREYTKECRHLLYIVDAVIDNALAGLPPVEPGQRSPKIKQQEVEIEDLRNTVSRLAGDLQTAIFALEEEQARVGALIEEKSSVEVEWQNLAASAREQSNVLNYVLGLADETLRAKAEGYREGLTDAKFL